MSGHSKWATIKRKKGATDAKRGKAFSKVIKEITIAARHGGGDPAGNPRLRTVIEKAKAVNMPHDNIQKAIKRGTGEIEGMVIEEITFEGYGPNGVAVMLEVTTDNRNRTVADIRHTFAKNGGNLGESNSVAWMFTRRGVIPVAKAGLSEDQLMEIALDAGADDLRDAGDIFEILTQPGDLHAVYEALLAKKVKADAGELRFEPQNTIKLDEAAAEKMLKLMELLEDHDDVQNVYANFDIDDAVMEKLSA